MTYDLFRTNVSTMNKKAPVAILTPLPTEAELAILNVLWSTGPATVREVFDALSGKEIGYTTVLKQMQVMAEKGLLERRRTLPIARLQSGTTQRTDPTAIGWEPAPTSVQRLRQEPRPWGTLVKEGLLC